MEEKPKWKDKTLDHVLSRIWTDSEDFFYRMVTQNLTGVYQNKIAN